MLLSFHFNQQKTNMAKSDMKLFSSNDLVGSDSLLLIEKYKKLPRVPLFLLLHYLFINDEDMMPIRTLLSIGRNVADCHPPKSIQKLMTLVRDLKTKKRITESMWFKKGDA